MLAFRSVIQASQVFAAAALADLQVPIVIPPLVMAPTETACNSTWCHIGQIINGEFFAALFGAIAGAIVTFFVTSRHERIKAVRMELAACNAAIGLAATVTSTAINLKTQFIMGIRERYASQFAQIAPFLFAPPGTQVRINYTFDFLYIHPPFTLVDELRKVILEKVPSSTKAQMLVAQLEQVANAQRRSIEVRNAMIAAIRNKFDGPRTNAQEEALAAWYFGLRDPLGHIDQSYPETLLAISTYTDAVIYFGMLLAEVLNLHGRDFRRRIKFNPPPVSQWEIDKEKIASLLPDLSDYKDYEKQYRGARMRLRDHSCLNKMRILVLRCIVPPSARRQIRNLWSRTARRNVAKKRRGLG